MEDQLKKDLIKAQLERDETKVSTLRLVLSGLTYLKVQKGLKNTDEKLPDSEVISVIQKEAKRRKEAIQAFRSGGREEQALKEETELKILESYLPSQLSNEELTKIVDMSINELGASSLQDMGKVMGKVMAKVGPGADGSTVSAIVKEKLSS